MHAQLKMLDGARAGEVRLVRKDFATIGRHPSADIGFDPDRDLEVSGRHAALFRQGDAWVLRDLGSTNGTYVNEVRIKGDRVLAQDDVIALGTKGPRLMFTARADSPRAPVGDADPDAAPTAPVRAPRPRKPVARRAPVHPRSRWRSSIGIVSTVAALAVTAVAGLTWRQGRMREREQAALLRQLDSMTSRLDSSTGSAAALSTALGDARAEADRLRRAIKDGPDAGRLAALSAEVSASQARHRSALLAAELDAASVARARIAAVVLVVSELPDRRGASGTGLTVRARGDTGWILTSRHLVVDPPGARAFRLGAVYHGTAQNFRARLVAISDSADLALIAVQVRGGVPEAPELATGAAAGDPVAILGFPLGFDFPIGTDWRKSGVRATTFSGSVTRVTSGTLEIDGYGATGSSGSPVFDAAGAVVGIVFGGDPRSQGRTLYAVPASVVRSFLKQNGLQ